MWRHVGTPADWHRQTLIQQIAESLQATYTPWINKSMTNWEASDALQSVLNSPGARSLEPDEISATVEMSLENLSPRIRAAIVRELFPPEYEALAVVSPPEGGEGETIPHTLTIELTEDDPVLPIVRAFDESAHWTDAMPIVINYMRSLFENGVPEEELRGLLRRLAVIESVGDISGQDAVQLIQASWSEIVDAAPLQEEDPLSPINDASLLEEEDPLSPIVAAFEESIHWTDAMPEVIDHLRSLWMAGLSPDHLRELIQRVRDIPELGQQSGQVIAAALETNLTRPLRRPYQPD